MQEVCSLLLLSVSVFEKRGHVVFEDAGVDFGELFFDEQGCTRLGVVNGCHGGLQRPCMHHADSPQPEWCAVDHRSSFWPTPVF